MAVIVEDGTGKTDAEAFCTVDDAVAYLVRRASRALADSSVDQQEAAVIQASEWLSNAYQWHGVRVRDTQALAWPRRGTTRRLPSGVPSRVVQATARVAEMIASGKNLFAAVEPGDMVRRVQAGSVSVEFSDDAIRTAATGGVTIPFLNDLLAGLYDRAPNDAGGNGISTQFVMRA